MVDRIESDQGPLSQENSTPSIPFVGDARNLILERIGSLYVPHKGPLGLVVLETLQSNEPNLTRIGQLREVTHLKDVGLYNLLRSLHRKSTDFDALITRGPAYRITPLGATFLGGLNRILEGLEIELKQTIRQTIYDKDRIIVAFKGEEIGTVRSSDPA